jgi:DNA-binding transcriptional MerR regulator
MTERHMQIGEVAERTSLSLRTIRYYEEVGLVLPSARSQGRFRLYTENDVERLTLVKRMKPLEFSLEEMRDLLDVVDALASPDLSASRRKALLGKLALYRDIADSRVEGLRNQLDSAESFAAGLRAHEARQTTRTGRR